MIHTAVGRMGTKRSLKTDFMGAVRVVPRAQVMELPAMLNRLGKAESHRFFFAEAVKRSCVYAALSSQQEELYMWEYILISGSEGFAERWRSGLAGRSEQGP